MIDVKVIGRWSVFKKTRQSIFGVILLAMCPGEVLPRIELGSLSWVPLIGAKR